MFHSTCRSPSSGLGLPRLLRSAIFYSNVWVAAGLASLVVLVQDTLELGFQWAPILLFFFATLIFYNLDRIADTRLQAIPDEEAQDFSRGGWAWILLSASIGFTVALLLMSDPSVLPVSIIGLIPLAYGLPLVPWRHGGRLGWRRLKDILRGSKAWIVAGTAACAVVVIPLAYANAAIDASALPTFLFLFLFLAVNAHLFDIRDLDSDCRSGVRTLPLMLGVRGARRVCFGLILTAALVAVLGWAHESAAPSPEVVLAWVGVNMLALSLVHLDRPRAWYDIWVDGLLFVPAAAIGLRYMF